MALTHKFFTMHPPILCGGDLHKNKSRLTEAKTHCDMIPSLFF